VDLWWRTTVPGLYAVGECAGTHGVTRPGGSALNAGQAGALRAAQWISAAKAAPTAEAAFMQAAETAVQQHQTFCQTMLEQENNVDAAIHAARRRMSDHGGAIRQHSAMAQALQEITSQLQNLEYTVGVGDISRLEYAYQLQDLLLTQQAVLTAMLDFSRTVGGTRGSALYYDAQGDLRDGLEDCFRFRPENSRVSDQIQTVRRTDDVWSVCWRPVRPIPQDDDFFENIWRQYRENQNIY